MSDEKLLQIFVGVVDAHLLKATDKLRRYFCMSINERFSFPLLSVNILLIVNSLGNEGFSNTVIHTRVPLDIIVKEKRSY